MKPHKIENIITQYEKTCNQFITEFCKKQDLDFDFWVADEVGSIASFACQYFFNLSDIILDLKTNQEKGFILDWQNESTDFNMFLTEEERKYINYQSYINGLRF